MAGQATKPAGSPGRGCRGGEKDGGGICVPGENGKIRVLFLCFSVCSTYLCGCECVSAAVLNKI